MAELTLTSESHNQVTWQVRHSTRSLLIGLFVIATLSISFLSAIPSPRRGVVLGSGGGITLLTLAWLAWRMPLSEGGSLERTLDGGTVRRDRRMVWPRKPEIEELALPNVTGFWLETRIFEETGGQTYTLSRVWALSDDPPPLLLTGWLRPAQAQKLGQSLAKAGRLTFFGS